MTRQQTTIISARLTFTMTALASALVLSGCAIKPTQVTQEEVRSRVTQDTQRMYADQVAISAPISMEEAVARGLKYNLDYRLKKMESALAFGLKEYASADMLPQLLASAGYRGRSNYSGGTSVGILDGIESTRPTSSDEKTHRSAGAEFSWNVLDFGVSYYRAKQLADQFQIAEERRRKVVQNIVQDVRAAYWRALGAQRLNQQAQTVMERANLALARSREAEAQKVIAPIVALNYQRALLDATTLLNQRRQDLDFARKELAALMNVPPGVEFTLAESAEEKLPAAPRDVRPLEEMALLQRPELREEDFKRRITADEARRQMMGILPNLSFNVGYNYDSNRYAYHNSWSDHGLRLSWNLMRLVALPSLKETQKQQELTDDVRRMDLSMAVMTQVRIGAERYRLALEDFKLADQAAVVDKRLADFTQAAVSAKLESELEAIRTQARAVLGAYQRANAYANAQISFGRLYNTLGFDPIDDDFDQDDLAKVTARLRQQLKLTEQDAFKMNSNLFGPRAAVSIEIEGVTDPVQRVRMVAQVSEILSRHEIDVTPQAPKLSLSLQQQAVEGLQKAQWSLSLQDVQGKVLANSRYTTTLPEQARGSAQESALVAAMTARINDLQQWLASAERGEKVQ